MAVARPPPQHAPPAPSALEAEVRVLRRQLDEAKRALAYRFTEERESDRVITPARKTTYISDRMLQVLVDGGAPDPETLLMARELGATDDDERQGEDDDRPSSRSVIGRHGKARVVQALERIPPFERELLIEHWVRRRSQRDLARAYKMSQPAVFYRLSRAMRRLSFFVEHPFSAVELLHALGAYVPPEHLTVLVTLWSAGLSQSQTARILGTSTAAIIRSVTRSRDALHAIGRRRRDLRGYGEMLDRLMAAKLWGIGREFAMPTNAKRRER